MEPAVAPQPLWIGSLPVQVSIKPIQHLHLSVVPPDGAVRISAPFGMGLEQIRTFEWNLVAFIILLILAAVAVIDFL